MTTFACAYRSELLCGILTPVTSIPVPSSAPCNGLDQSRVPASQVVGCPAAPEVSSTIGRRHMRPISSERIRRPSDSRFQAPAVETQFRTRQNRSGSLIRHDIFSFLSARILSSRDDAPPSVCWSKLVVPGHLLHRLHLGVQIAIVGSEFDRTFLASSAFPPA